MPILGRMRPGKFTRPAERVKHRKLFVNVDCYRCYESLCDECDKCNPNPYPRMVPRDFREEPKPVKLDPVPWRYTSAEMRNNFFMGMIVGAFVSAMALLAFITFAHALDHGFSTMPNRTDKDEWVAHLKVPGPEPRGSSCCGYGDLYEADIYERHPDGSYTAAITEGSAKVFPDGSVRAFVPNGTKIEVPADKVNPPKDGNPMGHAIIFLGTYELTPEQYNVYCFIPLPEGS